MNDITINWSAEDRVRIDKLIRLLEDISATQNPIPEQVTEIPQEVSASVVQETPTVTKQDILQKVIALCGIGKKAETKDIITTYADSVSDLPDSALMEVWNKLIALEG